MSIEVNDYNSKSEVTTHDLMPSVSMEVLFHLPGWHVYYVDPQGKYINCNEEACQFLEIPKDELLNKTDFQLPWKDNAAEWRQNDLKVMAKQQSLEFREELIHHNNKYICTSVKMPILHHHKIKGVLSLVKINETIPLHNLINENNISSRELQCLYYLTKGYKLKEIAQHLQISHRTVEHHLNHTKIKLKCYSKRDLIVKASQISHIKNQLLLEAVKQLSETRIK